MAGRHTVRDIIEQAFPNGYRDYARYLSDLRGSPKPRGKIRTTKPSFHQPPCSAVDLFAIAGQLLLKSGGYHHVCPDVSGKASPEMIIVTAAMRVQWRDVGEQWRGDGGGNLPEPPDALVEHWTGLMRFADEPIYRAPGFTATAREWWPHALALFCIADEAALDIGFRGKNASSAQALFIELPLRARTRASAIGAGRKGPTSLSLDANADVLTVLPKSRTPNVGCTLRSLSHNLAMLPGRGQARAHWSFTPEEELHDTATGSKPFNLIILPIPFAVRATAFRGFPADDPNWGWFDVVPHWCPTSRRGASQESRTMFIDFVDSLLAEAGRDCGEIHGLVLPEVALSEEVFRALCAHLTERPGFELLISGLFDAPASDGETIRTGNFTGMARFWRTETNNSYDIAIREKHHRWRIDRGQIETYALGTALDVNRGWWEHIDILNRSLDVFVIRGNATVTTLICEDLARNDPCQELVRGIGPNFVVALLMDGPQRADRWPARYATVLADDPGSSVLSVTSYGLLDRTNRTQAFDLASQIGLFRDDTGRATEIKLPRGAHGVCLTLQPTVLTEHTLDGRPDKGDAQSWRLAGVQPVIARVNTEDFEKGQWPGGVD